MANFQVRYWFESNSGDRSGEYVVEGVKANSAQDVARHVEANLSRPLFSIDPLIGPAQDGGLVIIQSPQVRFVEIVPSGPHM
jgi:hypothetical protein